MSPSDTRSVVYKDTVSPLNQAYNELLSLFSVGDTRSVYLRTFELTLSMNCPNKMLWNFDCYRDLARIAPIPDEPRVKIESGQFFNYLMVYEQIMREAGLIDQDPFVMDKPQEMNILMMGGEE